MQLSDQTGRRWLITGATHGLGEAVAVAAARAGATLVLPARNADLVAALNERLGGGHEVLHIDLADLGSVRAAASALSGEFDVLVNNAGTITTSREETSDGFEKVLGVNLLGPFALTNLLLPRVRERVVIVGSDAHKAGRFDLDDPHFRHTRWSIAGAYARSKLGDMLWGLALQRRLGSGRVVQLVHPGWVSSNLHAVVGRPRVERAITMISDLVASSPESSAECVLMAATADLPACSYVGPDGFSGLRGKPCLLGRSAAASDPELAEQVWRFAAGETGTDA